MCIIVAKPEGIDFPSDAILENCFNTNSDGAGFMFARGKEVRIRKGFMTFEDFIEALKAEDIKKYEACVMHFRIGTQGGNTKPNCHPFPIPCTDENVGKLSYESPIGMVHNGIINLCYSNDGMSDTMHYAIDVVTPLYRLVKSFMYNEEALDLLETTCESKLCFLNGLGDIVTVGDFIEDDGILYSNTSYLRKTYNYSSYTQVWNEHEWDDWKNESYPIVRLHDVCGYCYEYEGCKECGPLCVNDYEAYEYVQDQFGEDFDEEEFKEEERIYTID